MDIEHAMNRRLQSVILSKKIINLNLPLGSGSETTHTWTHNQQRQITMARPGVDISTTWTPWPGLE